MDLLYPALAAPLAIVAVRVWARWARSGGRGTFLTGVLACAVALDATRVLLRRVVEVPGGGPGREVLAAVLAAAALLAFRGWRDLGRSASEAAETGTGTEPQSGAEERSTK